MSDAIISKILATTIWFCFSGYFLIEVWTRDKLNSFRFVSAWLLLFICGGVALVFFEVFLVALKTAARKWW